MNSVCDVTCGATNGFTLLADLGIVTVPPDYSHLTHLDSFRRNHEECFSGFNDAIRDDNFANPSRVLKPGDQFWVRAHRPLPDRISGHECLGLLAAMRSHHVGAHGASLVFAQKRHRLPRGFWYASFDEPERLWQDAFGIHRVPKVCAGRDGVFDFYLGALHGAWRGYHAVLSFCDVPLGAHGES